MQTLEIVQHPHDILRQVAEPVLRFDESVQSIADDLTSTLMSVGGIGLCAPQVGISKRIIVTRPDATQPPRIYINPVIKAESRPGLVLESCLSLPGAQGTVKRAMRINVQAQTVSGECFGESLNDMNAVCMQHELDHLQGILFIDRLFWLSRWRLKYSPSTRTWWKTHRSIG